MPLAPATQFLWDCSDADIALASSRSTTLAAGGSAATHAAIRSATVLLSPRVFHLVVCGLTPRLAEASYVAVAAGS